MLGSLTTKMWLLLSLGQNPLLTMYTVRVSQDLRWYHYLHSCGHKMKLGVRALALTALSLGQKSYVPVVWITPLLLTQ